MPARRSPTAPALRGWQARMLGALEDWSDGPFLVSAAPGAGKTRPALELARRLLSTRAISRVVVVCPTAPLTRQWAAAAGRLAVQLAPDAPSAAPPPDFHGVAVTYARVASSPSEWASSVDAGTLVIADEAHHLGEELAWGTSFQHAFSRPRRWLLLSGTPFRSDATPIPGVRYDTSGLARPDISYTYAEAVRDGICRPVGFITYDGSLSWRSGEDVIESSFDTVLPAREASRRYRTAISTELPDGLPRILREADARLGEVRAQGHRDAGGLVVAADGSHARQVAKLLAEVTGRAPVVVLHTEARAAHKLAAFTASRERWLVAVNMVSEGVDIPRLRVGVYATAAKTPLIFRQIVGRFVRTVARGRGAQGTEPSWLYLPADPLLRQHAADIETELRHVLRAPEDDASMDELPRRESERSEQVEFVPLSAEMAAQMTLFGPPPGAPGGPPGPPLPTAPPGAGTREIPAYRRRALLRDKRHRLVSDLRRRDGRSHREINAELNRRVGIARVDDATIEQLERSVALLLDALSARR
ncbi:MAG TPA: DEAD/DEAH box helicase family protein [Solirubrobacteraceae bacterium]|nr:DEAD/DEAH box helicase family protein [Solirubrobacteraceae bacterium]